MWHQRPFQLVLLSVASCFMLYFMYSASRSTSSSQCPESHGYNRRPLEPFSYYDMDRPDTVNDTNIPHVLILTPFKEAARFIEPYFNNLHQLTYPHDRISLGFLVSDSKDDTIDLLRRTASRSMRGQHGWESPFHRIDIYQKDFDYDLPSNEDRHAFNVQVKRRQIMAKSRNTLLSAALTPEIDWVLWLDSDVVEYPATLLEELIGLDKDIIVPNCYWHSYNEEGGYDRNNWQETNESWAFQEGLKADDVLVEGYDELKTHRISLIDLRYEESSELMHVVPLDAVGGTCTLVKAQVHRDGAVFPTFPFQHQVETEGLAKMAKALGYSVWGLPNYLVYHYI
ncbi:Anp1-domain-containing protein [Gongronella butleri]|nr:Anp1-domain-containing protein [Gongronella butleri]